MRKKIIWKKYLKYNDLMKKQKIVISITAVLIIFVIASRIPQKKEALPTESAKQPTTVSTRQASESKELSQENQYPATVVADQEVRVTAKSTGTIMTAPANVGSAVIQGALLAKIDDTGSLNPGDEGLRNLQIQQIENSVAQAKKAYGLAKDVYQETRKSDTASGIEKDTAKTQMAIAKLQYENTLLTLNGSMDNHLITSPISGVITSKAVSKGDSVTAGQLIATVSKSSKVKIQFHVDQLQRDDLRVGQEIVATTSDENSIKLIIKNIPISADQTTKKFLIEAYPSKQASVSLLSGTIVNVLIKKNIQPKNSKNFILPLSAISVGQNESYIFVVKDGSAKKVAAQVENVIGEAAEISSDILPETPIIIEGGKLVQDGEIISIKN